MDGDSVFLQIKPLKAIIRSQVKDKMSPRYVGPFEILEHIGNYTYRLALPLEYSRMHNVFHISLLHRNVPDESHVIQMEPLEIHPNLTYEEHPVSILDIEDCCLWNKVVHLVKVQWQHQGMEEVTWELRDEMQHHYPNFFRCGFEDETFLGGRL